MSDALESFFAHQVIVKLYHFQTSSGFKHAKVDMYAMKFATSFDQFMEVWQGIYGQIQTKQVKIDARARDDAGFVEHLEDTIIFLRDLNVDGEDLPSELVTIRDQMIVDAQQLKYLMTFD
jgi:hypothetical protein